jgi:copper homeostasis protein
MGKLSLEIAVFSGHSALMAQSAGAHRVELNAPGSYASGGLTPPVSELTAIASELKIPLRIMIRPVGNPLPQGGRRHKTGGPVVSLNATSRPDFVYSPDEFELMKKSIEEFKATNLMNPVRGDGFVFGVLRHAVDSDYDVFTPHPPRMADLNDSGDDDDVYSELVVDTERCRMLTELAKPFPCVFHRAFDPIAANPRRVNSQLEALVKCNFDGLLTSGGPGSHAQHIENLDRIITHLKGIMQIIVGGSVRSHNVPNAVARLGVHDDNAVWFHSACLASSPTRDQDPEQLDVSEVATLIGCLEVKGRA